MTEFATAELTIEKPYGDGINKDGKEIARVEKAVKPLGYRFIAARLIPVDTTGDLAPVRDELLALANEFSIAADAITRGHPEHVDLDPYDIDRRVRKIEDALYAAGPAASA